MNFLRRVRRACTAFLRILSLVPKLERIIIDFDGQSGDSFKESPVRIPKKSTGKASDTGTIRA